MYHQLPSYILEQSFSFIPSAVAMLYADAMTLPYFEVHFRESSPVAPSRSIPLGKNPKVGSYIFLPVHGTCRKNDRVFTLVHYSCT